VRPTLVVRSVVATTIAVLGVGVAASAQSTWPEATGVFYSSAVWVVEAGQVTETRAQEHPPELHLTQFYGAPSSGGNYAVTFASVVPEYGTITEFNGTPVDHTTLVELIPPLGSGDRYLAGVASGGGHEVWRVPESGEPELVGPVDVTFAGNTMTVDVPVSSLGVDSDWYARAIVRAIDDEGNGWVTATPSLEFGWVIGGGLETEIAVSQPFRVVQGIPHPLIDCSFPESYEPSHVTVDYDEASANGFEYPDASLMVHFRNPVSMPTEIDGNPAGFVGVFVQMAQDADHTGAPWGVDFELSAGVPNYYDASEGFPGTDYGDAAEDGGYYPDAQTLRLPLSGVAWPEGSTNDPNPFPLTSDTAWHLAVFALDEGFNGCGALTTYATFLRTFDLPPDVVPTETVTPTETETPTPSQSGTTAPSEPATPTGLPTSTTGPPAIDDTGGTTPWIWIVTGGVILIMIGIVLFMLQDDCGRLYLALARLESEIKDWYERRKGRKLAPDDPLHIEGMRLLFRWLELVAKLEEEDCEGPPPVLPPDPYARPEHDLDDGQGEEDDDDDGPIVPPIGGGIVIGGPDEPVEPPRVPGETRQDTAGKIAAVTHDDECAKLAKKVAEVDEYLRELLDRLARAIAAGEKEDSPERTYLRETINRNQQWRSERVYELQKAGCPAPPPAPTIQMLPPGPAYFDPKTDQSPSGYSGAPKLPGSTLKDTADIIQKATEQQAKKPRLCEDGATRNEKTASQKFTVVTKGANCTLRLKSGTHQKNQELADAFDAIKDALGVEGGDGQYSHDGFAQAAQQMTDELKKLPPVTSMSGLWELEIVVPLTELTIQCRTWEICQSEAWHPQNARGAESAKKADHKYATGSDADDNRAVIKALAAAKKAIDDATQAARDAVGYCG